MYYVELGKPYMLLSYEVSNRKEKKGQKKGIESKSCFVMKTDRGSIFALIRKDADLSHGIS